MTLGPSSTRTDCSLFFNQNQSKSNFHLIISNEELFSLLYVVNICHLPKNKIQALDDKSSVLLSITIPTLIGAFHTVMWQFPYYLMITKQNQHKNTW